MGIWLGSMGLFAQAYWSYDYILNGDAAFNGYPLWVLKDIALFLIIISFTMLVHEKSKRNMSE
jgi:hypothetical protein